jgi:hypothetical protein
MKIYIAGPMTGHPDMNYPAFHAAAAELRALGHVVINPAENPEPAGATPRQKWLGYMRISIAQMTTVDAVCMLPGWEKSSGALKEHTIAGWLMIPILTDASKMWGFL